MPSYGTHSIHGELVLPRVERVIEIDDEDLHNGGIILPKEIVLPNVNVEDVKVFCMGPDTMILTDYKTFDYQHANKTRDFFLYLIKLIKEKKLYDNPKAMAFLYGQLAHFILDSTMHPLIYYMTQGIERTHKIKPHGLVEMWMDDYSRQKYCKNDMFYYHRYRIGDRELKAVVDELYQEVYNVENESIKYSIGMFANIMFDVLARKNLLGIVPLVAKVANLGDFTSKKDLERVLPFLNLNHEEWRNPETGELYTDSFDDLMEKAIIATLEIIRDVNNNIYLDNPLHNRFILENCSFNTGLPCEKGQSLHHIKTYK